MGQFWTHLVGQFSTPLDTGITSIPVLTKNTNNPLRLNGNIGNVSSVSKSDSVVSKTLQKQLLPGEGRVGTYGMLDKLSKPGDNLSAHHIPHKQYMKKYNIKTQDGISILVEDYNPNPGGRHKEIHKNFQKQELTKHPRDALAEGVIKFRQVYKRDRVYDHKIQKELKGVIEQNKKTFPHLFEKNK